MGTIATMAFGRLSPVSASVPFTYRDGATVLKMLYDLRDHLNTAVQPELFAEVQRVIDETTVILDKMGDAVNEALIYVGDSIESINNKTGGIEIQRITLTKAHTLTIDPLWPSNHPVFVSFTQDAIGSHEVSLADNISGDYIINPMPRSVSEFWLIPNADTGEWAVSDTNTMYPSTETVSALIGDLTMLIRDVESATQDEKGAAGGIATLGADGKVPATQLPTPKPEQEFSLVGTYAQRPVASTVKVGAVYFATDTQEGYRSNGVEWSTITNGGGLLGMAEMFGGTTTTTTKALSQMVVTFRPGTRPVEIGFYGDLANSEYGGTSSVQITMDNEPIFECLNTAVLENRWAPVSKATFRQNLTPGKLYTVRATLAKTWGEGTAMLDGNGNKPATLYVKSA